MIDKKKKIKNDSLFLIMKEKYRIKRRTTPNK